MIKDYRVIGITYSDLKMKRSANRCVFSMLKNGCDEAYKSDVDDIPMDFLISNKITLSEDRGIGYWLWKPYIINDQIQMMQNGDILIYSDAGVELIGDVNEIIKRMDQDVWLFGNKYRHIDWCKKECLDAMGYEIDVDYGYGGHKFIDDRNKQVQASVIFIRVSQYSRDFIKRWLLWCQMPDMINDKLDPSKQLLTFREHRHDQAILTNLAIKEGIKLHYWPASYNNGAFTYETDGYDRSIDNYPILFNHHRMRNDEY